MLIMYNGFLMVFTKKMAFMSVLFRDAFFDQLLEIF